MRKDRDPRVTAARAWVAKYAAAYPGAVSPSATVVNGLLAYIEEQEVKQHADPQRPVRKGVH